MTGNKKHIKIAGFNLFEATLIAIVSVISTAFFVNTALTGTEDGSVLGYAALELVAAFCGICSVVLCAKGKRSGFIFGLVNVVSYSIISYHNSYYGEVMLNMLFYTPSNIIAYILWTRHKDEQRGGREVKARALTPKQTALSLAVIAVVTVGYHFVLEAMGGAMTYLDGATTVLSIFATVLMALRFSEQWLYWIIVDVLTVALWVIAGDPVMVVMWSAYLVNAFYGYAMWLNKSGRRVPFKSLLDVAAE